MNTNGTPPAGVIERALVALDQSPWDAVFRTAIGFALVPGVELLTGSDRVGWQIVVWFIGLLTALRLLPVAARKVLPFSEESVAIWQSRRMMAKRFDSYQWRKLFWIGSGLVAFVLLHGEADHAVIALAMFCVVGGLAGLAIFRVRLRSLMGRRVPDARRRPVASSGANSQSQD